MQRFAKLCALFVLFASMATTAEPVAGPAPGASPVAVERRIVLVVDEWKALRNLPVLVAERLGYFKEGGRDVIIVNVRDDVWHGDLVMDGRADAVMAYWHHNAVNQSLGRDTEAIVTLGVTPGMKVLVANDAKEKFRTPTDLRGARIIAGGAGSSKSTVANALVLAGGLTLGDYKRLGTEGVAQNTEALRTGGADLLVTPAPDAEAYERAGVADVFADLTSLESTRQAFGVAFPTATVFMSRERVKAHPEIARHLARAFVRALQYMHAHSPEEIAALIPPEDMGKDRAQYLRALRDALPMFATDGHMPPEGAAFELRVLAAFEPKLSGIAPERTYTNDFVDEALRAQR